MTDVDKTKAGRIKLFRDAANFKQTQRVPHFANVVTWKVFDAGHTLDEAMTDFGVMEECVVHFLDTYPVDGMLDLGIRNQFNITEAFGPGSYYYHDSEVVGEKDHSFCTPDTLSEYLADPQRYIWEKVLPAKYGDDWAQKSPEVWKRTFDEFMKFVKYLLHISNVAGKRYQLPSLAPNNPMSGEITFGIEALEANILGIQQLAVAMRRSPDKLDEFIEAWDREKITPVIEKVRASGKPSEKFCYDASILMLAHNIMSTKQFERFYWPHMKELLDAYAERGMNVRIFAEGSIMRYCEYFAGYPKGAITLHLEQDDPFEIREKLPNVAIMGGMTTELLSRGTKEECIENAKQLINGLAEDGGYIFSENKMLSYRNDATHENMLAVCEFVDGYRG